jgi:hypothetical protein
MQNQFKPGDLALIVGANELYENIGKQCQLVQCVTKGEYFTAPDGKVYEHDDMDCWVVICPGILSWFEGGEIIKSFWGICEPRHLMPIKGTETPQLEKQKEVVHG